MSEALECEGQDGEEMKEQIEERVSNVEEAYKYLNDEYPKIHKVEKVDFVHVSLKPIILNKNFWDDHRSYVQI